jgi:hypothetical protein
MTWLDVLLFIGILNGLLAVGNAIAFYRMHDYTPMWLKIVALAIVFGCSVSCISTIRYVLAYA